MTWQAYTMHMMLAESAYQRTKRLGRILLLWQRMYNGIAVPDDNVVEHTRNSTIMTVDQMIQFHCIKGDPVIYISIANTPGVFKARSYTTKRAYELLVIKIGRAIKAEGDHKRRMRNSFGNELIDAIMAVGGENATDAYDEIADDPFGYPYTPDGR
jgi:hypothetical protein